MLIIIPGVPVCEVLPKKKRFAVSQYCPKPMRLSDWQFIFYPSSSWLMQENTFVLQTHSFDRHECLIEAMVIRGY